MQFLWFSRGTFPHSWCRRRSHRRQGAGVVTAAGGKKETEGEREEDVSFARRRKVILSNRPSPAIRLAWATRLVVTFAGCLGCCFCPFALRTA